MIHLTLLETITSEFPFDFDPNRPALSMLETWDSAYFKNKLKGIFYGLRPDYEIIPIIEGLMNVDPTQRATMAQQKDQLLTMTTSTAPLSEVFSNYLRA